MSLPIKFMVQTYL